MVFLTLLAQGLEDDPAQAVAKTLAILGPERSDGPVRLTCVISDGNALYAFRYASDGKCPTLYLTEQTEHGGKALASEPLCGGVRHWRAIPPNCLVRIDADTTVETPLRLPELVA